MELYQRFFAPHYIINFLYVLQFFVIRYVPSLGSHYLDLSLEPPEKIIYIVFLILVLIKFKSSSNAEEFLSIFFVYGKFLNLVMFYWYGKTLWTVLYAIIWGHVHFGKIDLDCYEDVSQKLDISLSPTSLDLPTLILFKNGKEIGRLPQKIRDGSNEDLDKIKNKTLRNAKVTWDRLGWDRSTVNINF
ncbi:4317_t:CDS:2 [Diversispora eburnea]|uniref:4317_t:CDS:1 n=1 Tax=Diversispora eburnea TaxID=1213867 RepID=A0A9N9FSM2_9GLOM|nr:4317_t:CDS:2 [Diversispora eburnea]